MRRFQEYDQMLEWLFGQFPSYQTVGGRAYKSGIDTMMAFDALLGHPHREFRSIHVAGTNGKGSTCSMLAAALASCGLRVGLYTSPHMTDFRERMKIVEWGAGRPYGEGSSFVMVPREFVLDFVERYFDFFESEKPSFFEITTAMAFSWFASEHVDVAVIETGLGGRLDSTNIITPLLSVITNIGLEHCQYLGDTLEAIASEKAGIIKPAVPALIGESLPETRPAFEAAALHCAGKSGIAAPVGEILPENPPVLEAADLIGESLPENHSVLDPSGRHGGGKSGVPAEGSHHCVGQAGVPAEGSLHCGGQAGVAAEGSHHFVGQSGVQAEQEMDGEGLEASPLYFASEMEPFLDVTPADLDLAGDCQTLNLRTAQAALKVIAERFPGLVSRDGSEADTCSCSRTDSCSVPGVHSNLPSQDSFPELASRDGSEADSCSVLGVHPTLAPQDSLPGLEAGRLAEGLRHAAAITGLHGRWETVRCAGEGHARIICDAGHNAHAFRWIREQIDKYSCDYGRIVFILGVVADKDLDAIAGFLPRDVDYIFTQPTSGRALPVADLANALHDCGITGRTARTLPEALALADTLAAESDLIFIAGSCYLISDLLSLLAIH